jgi:hypothetical protein
MYITLPLGKDSMCSVDFKRSIGNNISSVSLLSSTNISILEKLNTLVKSDAYIYEITKNKVYLSLHGGMSCNFSA